MFSEGSNSVGENKIKTKDEEEEKKSTGVRIKCLCFFKIYEMKSVKSELLVTNSRKMIEQKR